MKKEYIAAIVVMMMCCSSSSMASMMMGGGEETPSAGAGAGEETPSAGAGAGTESTETSNEFVDSILPEPTDATILNPGSSLARGEKWEPPNKSYDMTLQGDNNLCINEPGKARACLMSHQVGGTATTDFQGDGNLCVNGQPGVKCHMSHDSNVPSGQHRLILHNNGDVYVDHGTGESNRSMIYDHP
jgi:hypothetical protein